MAPMREVIYFELGDTIIEIVSADNPKPKSEAWLICAVKDIPYQNCHQLEDRTGNNDGELPLKEELSDILEGQDSVIDINQMLKDKRIDIERIDMLSFIVFRDVLDSVVKNVMGKK